MNFWRLAPIVALSTTLMGFGSCGSDEIKCVQGEDVPDLTPGGYALVRVRCSGLGRDEGLSFVASSQPAGAVSVITQVYYYPGESESQSYRLLVQGSEAMSPGARASVNYTIKYRDGQTGVARTGVGTFRFVFAAPVEPEYKLKVRAASQNIVPSENISIPPGATVTVSATGEDSVGKISSTTPALSWIARGFSAEQSDIRRQLLQGGGVDFNGTNSTLTDAPESARAYEVLARDARGVLQLERSIVEIAGQTAPLTVALSLEPKASGSEVEVVATVEGGIKPYLLDWDPNPRSGEGTPRATFGVTDSDQVVHLDVVDAKGGEGLRESITIPAAPTATQPQLMLTIINQSSANDVYVRSGAYDYECNSSETSCLPLRVDAGSMVDLSAETRNDASVEVEWGGDCAFAGKSSSTTVTVTEDTTCTVTFSDRSCHADFVPSLAVHYVDPISSEELEALALEHNGELMYFVQKQVDVILAVDLGSDGSAMSLGWNFDESDTGVPEPQLIRGRPNAKTFQFDFVGQLLVAKVRASDPACDAPLPEVTARICSFVQSHGFNEDGVPNDCIAR
ncbi:MAG: hypothetical protein IPK13_05950 [Deltaproteobacteria bacterium]|nr:hypothetical protein [Deltaproteobacteria bacterium]